MFNLPGLPNLSEMTSKIDEFQALFAQAVGTMAEMRDDLREVKAELAEVRAELKSLKEDK